MRERKIHLSKEQKKTIISIILSLAQGICVIFIGLTIGFIFYYVGFQNPYLNKISTVLDRDAIEIVLQQIGWYDPLPIKFIKYINNFFSGNWGESYSIFEGEQVIDVMRDVIPHTIELILLPTLIGLVGIKLGRIWARKRKEIQGRIIQIFTVIGLALPIFFIILAMQYSFQDILPILFRTEPGNPEPPFITGLDLFDSLITGNWDLARDYARHYILPVISLSFVILALIIKQTKNNIDNNSSDVRFISNSFTAAKMFGLILPLILLVEMIFNLTGFGYYLMMSIYGGDIFLLNSCIFIIIISFAFIIFLSNIVPIVYKYLKKRLPKLFKSFPEPQPIMVEQKYEENSIRNTSLKVELKNYVITTLKNPFALVGLGLIIFLGFIAAFPQLITPYSLNESTMALPYAPPSTQHPLGTTKNGYDLLAQLIWGTRDVLLFGFQAVLIGLIGGVIFGVIAGKIHRYIYNGIIGSMLVLYIIPGFVLLVLLTLLAGKHYLFSISMIGIFLIPSFTYMIANAIRNERNTINIIKRIIKFIPLEIAFAILLYHSLGVLRVMDETTAQLGITFSYGIGHLKVFWPVFGPGFFIFLILLGFILLHEGLEAPIKSREVI